MKVVIHTPVATSRGRDSFLDWVHYPLKSPALPAGKTELKFKLTATRMFGGGTGKKD